MDTLVNNYAVLIRNMNASDWLGYSVITYWEYSKLKYGVITLIGSLEEKHRLNAELFAAGSELVIFDTITWNELDDLLPSNMVVIVQKDRVYCPLGEPSEQTNHHISP